MIISKSQLSSCFCRVNPGGGPLVASLTGLAVIVGAGAGAGAGAIGAGAIGAIGAVGAIGAIGVVGTIGAVGVARIVGALISSRRISFLSLNHFSARSYSFFFPKLYEPPFSY